jgi:hypothetical protein
MRNAILTGIMVLALATAGLAAPRPASAFSMPKPDADGAAIAMTHTDDARPLLVAMVEPPDPC